MAQDAPPAVVTLDATQGETVPGLLYELYELPRRPKTVRNLLPGVVPTNVGLLTALQFTRDEGFDGPKESIQIEVHGQVHAHVAGEYIFTVKADDGAELYVDGEFLGRNVWSGSNTPPTGGTITLTKGWHNLRCRFYQGDGGAGLTVQWQPPDAVEVVAIPTESLRVSADRLNTSLNAVNDPGSLASDDPEFAYREIFSTQGFFELPEKEGDLLVDLLEGSTLYNAAVRSDFNNLLESTNYHDIPYWQQVKVLAGSMRGWPYEQTSRGEVTRRDPYTSTDPEPTPYDGWRGAKREGFVQTLAFDDGHNITVFTPVQDAIEQDIVPKALAGLPASLRGLIHKVIVEPYGTASEYNGGGDTIWVRLGGPASQDGLDSTFSHEAGHLLMDRTQCLEPWREAVAAELLSLSHYGRLNPWEDFAEFTRLYLSTNGDASQRSSLESIFPHRLKAMEDALDQVGFAWPDAIGE